MSLRRTLSACLGLVLSTALVAACVILPGERQASADRPVPLAAGSADDPVNFVVAISVDGLNPSALRRLGRSGAPGIWRMVSHGAATFNARTEYERTNTLPNHTGMVTGRWVTRSGGHRVTFNDDNGSTVHRTAGGYVASMFDVVHNHGGSTAFYSAKTKFDFLNRSWDARHGARDRVGVNNGRDKIDRYVVDGEAANVTRLIRRLHRHPDELSFVHLAEPDRAGHAYGFMSGRYLDAVHRADHQVARILNAVARDTRLRRHVNVVLTADHGGRGATHTDRTKVYNYTVPFLVWGVGVAKGANLYSLNSNDRKRPYRTRPTYAGRQPIRNGEVANLVTDLLDLPRVPGSTFNTGRNLSVR